MLPATRCPFLPRETAMGVKLAGPARRVSEPALVVKDKAGYRPLPLKIFRGNPRGEDVLQGGIGDCFFMAPLASMAKANPRAIKNAITDNKDGTATVRFFRHQPDSKKFVPLNVVVDIKVPTRNHAPVYGSSRDNDLWVSIYEKAYAKLRGGYPRLAGGTFEPAIEKLTGRPTQKVLPTDPHLFEKLSEALRNGKFVVAENPVHGFSVWGVSKLRGTPMVVFRDQAEGHQSGLVLNAAAPRPGIIKALPLSAVRSGIPFPPSPVPLPFVAFTIGDSSRLLQK